jgi:hypothetical protein
MWFLELGTPITSSDRDNGKFGGDDSTSDGSGDFLCAFDAQTDVTIGITDCDECLESSSLTGTGLLLDRHNLHNFIFEFWKEEINDLVFLNG